MNYLAENKALVPALDGAHALDALSGMDFTPDNKAVTVAERNDKWEAVESSAINFESVQVFSPVGQGGPMFVGYFF